MDRITATRIAVGSAVVASVMIFAGPQSVGATTCYSSPTWWNMDWEANGSDAEMDWPNWNSAWFAPQDSHGRAIKNSDKPPRLNSNEYARAGWTARSAGNNSGHYFGGFYAYDDGYARHVGQHLRMCGTTAH